MDAHYPPHLALVYPVENAASAVTELDGKRVFNLSGKPIGVPAGAHRIEVTTCPEGASSGCSPRLYALHWKAGLAYHIRRQNLIEVFNRTDMAAGRIDTLVWNGNTFIDQKEQSRTLAIRAAERVRNVSRIRKVGARICQSFDGHRAREGYVESMTDEKVQIRLSGMSWNLEPVQEIVWDDPINWDPCEEAT